jgi:hypothetical protein
MSLADPTNWVRLNLKKGGLISARQGWGRSQPNKSFSFFLVWAVPSPTIWAGP